MSRGRVLLVDDDEEIREFVALVLKSEGYEIECAGDGQAALEVLATRPPALVLLDLRMPGLDGASVVSEYHARCVAPVPVVVMTAVRDADVIARVPDAAGCLTKPFDLDELLDVVHRFAGTGRR